MYIRIKTGSWLLKHDEDQSHSQLKGKYTISSHVVIKI